MGNPDEAAAPAAAAAPRGGREKCSHGETCYRKNPEHKAEFSHPGDDDWATGGYQAGAAASAPYPDQTEEDKGLMGGLGGAAAAAAALGGANHFGAFAGKTDPNDPQGKAHGFAQDHKIAAGLLAAGAVVAAGIAGSKLQDGMAGGGKDSKHGKAGKESGGIGAMLGGLTGGLLGGKKKKTGKKKDKKGKEGKSGKDGKDKKKKGSKSRDLGDDVQTRDFDPNAESSGEESSDSCETGPEDEGYDPVKHSDGRPRTP